MLQFLLEENKIPFYPNSGYIKVGFCNAFRSITQEINYAKQIKDVISEGGDTGKTICL